ncbi:hypothetical protein E2562_029828 [Oryza meyeriana var. granulata]|uniref:Uncharacterized protein n=1 Tax=Oryza meyeriana var. granulata TaxID=110450 RepID=A0A6G1CUC1_9ORYZ|nr:hypothetical protein E2562_029828 [Oryza meyeriana var. granulata]KAF0903766.1 hypothetical protein E2562_029828 [Oryza meyeriana var. granulata]KAF0903767.1 hypothetical protein E2562_029828 [Oryza meyeriana var. granulata]KAF0903768.1 hypothetical protein E2562_029828 [Oryza meyeriana var. granulata]
MDDMVEAGMVDELQENFTTTTATKRAAHVGLGKAIGIPALGSYFVVGGCALLLLVAHFGTFVRISLGLLRGFTVKADSIWKTMVCE